MTGLEPLVREYIEAQTDYKKNKILRKILDLYNHATIRFCNRYRSLEEPEVIKQHVHIGIMLALEKFNMDFDNLDAFIFYHIQREIRQFIVQHVYRDKRAGIEISIEELEYHLTDKKILSEDAIVTKIDIENAVRKLSLTNRIIVTLWLSGYSLNDMKSYLSKIEDKISVKGSSIYYYFNDLKHILKGYLDDYSYA